MADGDHSFLLGFVGYAEPAQAERASEYEDAVLALLTDHGARVAFRGRRVEGQDHVLPLEVHLLWFPGREAFDAYLADPRRVALLREYGEVFATKHAVELETTSLDPSGFFGR
ncbi:MAG TPA: hypothetical protein VL119_12290 [Acidimicrobiia bacterium]|nr:hypothetical protein [Acidimicrobiia bacterium]